MPKIGALKTFTTGQKPIPSAHINANFADIKAVVNALDKANIDLSGQIGVNDENQVVTGIKTFTTNPVFNAGGIADASLTPNVVLLNASQVVSGSKECALPIAGLKAPTLSAHPSTAAADKSIYRLSGDGFLYIYHHGSGAVRLDQTPGAYAGGAPNTYSGMNAIDNANPLELEFRCDSGFSSAVIRLRGLGFPSWAYTELGEHAHSPGSLALASGSLLNKDHLHDTVLDHGHPGTTFGSSAHVHLAGRHTHAKGTFAINPVPAHDHGGNTGYFSIADGEGMAVPHRHSVASEGSVALSLSGNSANEGDVNTGAPSAAASVSSYSGTKTSGNPSYPVAPEVGTSLSGTSATAGVNGGAISATQKTNLTASIKIYISQDLSVGWGTGYDSGTFPALANINDANGTGDINITSYCSAGQNFVKIVDETASTGGTVSWHLRTI